MSGHSTYNYKSPEGFTIENGVLKGAVVPPVTKHTHGGEWILDCLRAKPEFVGQVDAATGRKNTFAEMTERSVKCALWMREQGIEPGDVIGICSHNHMDIYVPCFASLYVGAVFNPWCNEGLDRDITRHFVTLTKPKLLFADEASAGLAADVAREVGVEFKVVVFGKVKGFQSLDEILASQQDAKLVSEFRCTKLSSPDDPALIIYSSGTTGLPKAVSQTHRYLVKSMKVKEWCDVDGPVTTMIFSSIAWTSGIIFMVKGVVQPEVRIIPPVFGKEVIFQLIEKFKINCILLGTSNACRLYQSPAISNYDLSSLKKILMTGEVLNAGRHKAMGAKFPQTIISSVYGCTEFMCLVVESEAGAKFGSCGTIVPNFSLKVVDIDTGKILGPNQKGEALCKTPYMLTGYYNNTKPRSEIFDAEGWYRTGDLVYYDEEGTLFVADRIKEMIDYRGNRVSPTTIESVLLKHPGVAEAAVISIPDDADGEHPIAFVSRTPVSEVTKAELEELVAQTLPSYMKLRGGVEFMDELPQTATGKIARVQLKKLARASLRS